MSASLSSFILRSSAAKGIGVFSRTVRSRTRTAFLVSSNNIHTTLQKLDDSHSRIRHPEPLPAVAYDHSDDENDCSKRICPADNDDVTRETYVTSESGLSQQNMASDGNKSSRETHPPASFASLPFKRQSSGGSGGGGTGGGGTGRCRCTKCGTIVTFRHSDFDENSYYCATCGGWFLAPPPVVAGKDEFMDGNGGASKDPEILMQHVSPLPSLFHAPIHFFNFFLALIVS